MNDYEIGRRVGLESINIMNDDGSLNAAAGAYAGLDRFAARKQLWADMEVRCGRGQDRGGDAEGQVLQCALTCSVCGGRTRWCNSCWAGMCNRPGDTTSWTHCPKPKPPTP